MENKLDGKTLGKYALMAVGAVGVPMMLGRFDAAATLLNSTIMTYSLAGIMVKDIVLSGVGIGLIDQLVYSAK